MEPLSCLAIATGVIQFVDCSSRILSGVGRIRASSTGQLPEYEELQQTTTALAAICHYLSQPPQKDGVDTSTSLGKALQTLCLGCSDLADELLDALEHVAGKGHRARVPGQSILVALRGIWNQEKITRLQSRINEFRQQLVLTVLVSLREEGSHISRQPLASTRGVGEEFLRHIEDSKRWQRDLLQAIQESHSTDLAVSQPLSPAPINTTLKNFYELVKVALSFLEIHDRWDHVSEAHRKTFDWVFQKPRAGAWDSFVDWLGDGSPLYWIAGKAGAGKSTLIKHILRDSRLRSSLQPPGFCGEFIIVPFFFWNSGSQNQMSMEGCLRSLLYESLSRCPDLAHVVFPDLWEAFNLFNIPPTATWTMPQLQRGFDRLLCQANRDRRLFFLIDGLDEFGEDHAVLITMIEKICARPNVKLCVSSRPWIEFEDAFIAKPTLRLEDLTYPDIKHFISSKLESHPAFGKLKKEEPIFTKDLVESTTKKSSGVFLWVSLVVKSLMTGMANGDRVVELEQRLIALPADLEGLFNKILQSVEGTYKMDASHLIQLVRSSREPITLLRLFFADEANVAAALKYPVGKISAEEEDTKCERMRRRLNSRCKGLLEASGHGRWSQKTVGYLHRTVREWIEKPETWGKILAATRDDFDPSLELAKSYLLLLKARGNSSSHDIWRYAMPCIMYASESNSSMDCIVALLDGLDNAASTAFSPTSAQALQQFHWCATNHSSTEVDDFPSFLHLAVKLQLDWYLRVKLGFIQSTNHVRGPPLLLSAILDYNQVHFQFLPKEMQDKVPRRPSPDTVKLLLEAGETPNQKYRGSTPWKKVIERTTTDGWMPPWRQIVPLFVQHGADIKAPLELQSVLSEDKRQVWIEEIKRWKKEGNFRETSRNPVSARRFSRVLFPFRSG